MYVLVLEKKIAGSHGPSVPPACKEDAAILPQCLIRKMQLVEKARFRRTVTTVEGYKRSYQVTLPRHGQPSNPAKLIEERAHLGLWSLWREAKEEDSVRKRVCKLNADGTLDVPQSVEAAVEEIERLEANVKAGEKLSADENQFLTVRSLTKSMLSKHGENEDEAEPKTKAKPRAIAVLNSEVSLDLMQLVIARFVKTEPKGTLLFADVCCGTGALQRALVTLADCLDAATRCVSLDIDSHVLHYAQLAYRGSLERFYSVFLTANRVKVKQSTSQTTRLHRNPMLLVSGAQVCSTQQQIADAVCFACSKLTVASHVPLRVSCSRSWRHFCLLLSRSNIHPCAIAAARSCSA